MGASKMIENLEQKKNILGTYPIPKHAFEEVSTNLDEKPK
jgi:hypothetical protein